MGSSAKTYEDKRDFEVTPEPSPKKRSSRKRGPLRFVVQRHEASHLHFDFRLECDGVLKSWAVPKGPSLSPKVRRAAIMVEDHPFDYRNFEGRIPHGQYGGGEVILWDEGSYAPEGGTGDAIKDEKIVRQGLAEGKLSFVLSGTRLKGSFVLVRTAESDNWLLIKRHDEFESDVDPTKQTSSIRSGLTAEDLRAGVLSRSPHAEAPNTLPVSDEGETVPVSQQKSSAPPTKGTDSLTIPKAMVPKEIDQPFTREGWIFEPKLDGVRVLAMKEGARVRLITRNGNDIADRFPDIVASVTRLDSDSLILDGELLYLDAQGQSSFQSLMESYHARRSGMTEVAYFVFDLLYLNGSDLRKRSLEERKEVLLTVQLDGLIRRVESVPTDGELLFREAMRLGFEGIVGKRLSSPYREGVVSDDWVKVKSYHSEEFLICGYTQGQGARESTFGALLLGQISEDRTLHYCGSVGGGFSDRQLVELRADLDRRRVQVSPFQEEISTKGKARYVAPEQLAEVRFMNWTKDHHLRFPIFLRLRPDLPMPKMLKSRQSPHQESSDNPAIEAIQDSGSDLDLEIDGHVMHFTSLDKELWPKLCKRDLLLYLIRVSVVFLPHLRNRPLTFVRYPDGIFGEGFFQRHWEKGRPPFVETVEIFSDHNDQVGRHLLCNNLATLLWLGQIGGLEIHPWHSRIDKAPDAASLGTDFRTLKSLKESVLEYPDFLVCDLDPNIRSGKEAAGAEPELNEEGWRRTVEVALGLREMLEQLNLKSFVKTTGKTGLHIFIPIERRYDSNQVREAARTLGKHLMEKMAEQITMEIRLNKRPDKVFFDANMNGRGKTLASAYSPRPVPGALVSMPLDWSDLPHVHPSDFTIRTVPNLLKTSPDQWVHIGDFRQRLA